MLEIFNIETLIVWDWVNSLIWSKSGQNWDMIDIDQQKDRYMVAGSPGHAWSNGLTYIVIYMQVKKAC